MPLTRRRLLATTGAGVAGGGAAFLSSCGSDADEPSSERDQELLLTMLSAETAVAGAYALARRQGLEPEAMAAVDAFAEAADAHLGRLDDAVEGSPDEGDQGFEQGENVLEAVALRLDDAIAAAHGAVGELSSVELRRTAFELMSDNAAQLAAITGLLGEDQAPEAFVTGGTREPAAEEG